MVHLENAISNEHWTFLLGLEDLLRWFKSLLLNYIRLYFHVLKICLDGLSFEPEILHEPSILSNRSPLSFHFTYSIL